jgi:uncharacterized protein (TIGR02266 family)
VTSEKAVLVAHRSPAVRATFAAALETARHRFVPADSEARALAAVSGPADAPSLAVVDLTMAEDELEFVRQLRTRAGEQLAIVVSAGSVGSAALVPPLVALGVTFLNEHAAPAEILPALAPHLFPDSFNRRASPRVAIGVPVSYRIEHTASGATTLNVGKGGVAIRTMHPPAAGTALGLRFRLPASSSEIDAAGRVVWSDPRVGMGVEFDQMTPAEQDDLDAFVDRETHRQTG